MESVESQQKTNREDVKCDKYEVFHAEAQKLFKRQSLRESVGSRVEWQSESRLHKAAVEAGAALEPELLREEAKKVFL